MEFLQYVLRRAVKGYRFGLPHHHSPEKGGRIGHREHLDDSLHRFRQASDRNIHAGEEADQRTYDCACRTKSILTFNFFAIRSYAF